MVSIEYTASKIKVFAANDERERDGDNSKGAEIIQQETYVVDKLQKIIDRCNRDVFRSFHLHLELTNPEECCY